MEMMKAIQAAAKGEPVELVEIPVPQPGKGQMLLKAEACGIRYRRIGTSSEIFRRNIYHSSVRIKLLIYGRLPESTSS